MVNKPFINRTTVRKTGLVTDVGVLLGSQTHMLVLEEDGPGKSGYGIF